MASSNSNIRVDQEVTGVHRVDTSQEVLEHSLVVITVHRFVPTSNVVQFGHY